jgi:tetratricopeptide (TPR) repeat protein
VRLIVVILIVGAILLVGELLGAFRPTPQNWGVHHYGFLPRAWLWAGIASALAVFALFRHGFFGIRLRGGAGAGAAAAALVGGGLFWVARSRNFLLGDSFMWLESVRQGRLPWVHDPLAAFSGYYANVALGRPDPTLSYALLSTLAGMIYLALSVGIARALTEDTRARWFLFLLLAAAGWTRMFYGFAGSFPLLAAATTGFLLVAVLHLRGRAGALGVAITGTLPALLHVSGLWLLPSLVVVLLLGPEDSREGRGRRLLTLLVPAAGILGLCVAWARTPLGLVPVLSAYFGNLLPPGESSSLLVPYALFSPHHLLDLLQEQLLLGPFAGLLLLLLALGGLVVWRDRTVRFLLWAGVPGWIFSLFALRALGAPRLWDAFAIFSVPLLLAAGRSVILLVAERPVRAGWVMGILAGLTVFHTLPWIGLGASSDRSIAHFVALFGRGSSASSSGRAQAFDDLGTVYLEWGDSDRALGAYEAAALFDTTSAYATGHWGSVLLSRGRTEEAILVLKRAARLDPGYAYAHFDLGNAYRTAGFPDSAMMSYRKAVELNEDFLQAGINLAVVARSRGRLEEAEEVLLHMQQRFPGDPLILSNLARLEMDHGDTLQAVALYEEALRADPGNTDTAYNLGLVLLRISRPEEAARYFEQVVETRSGDVEAWVNLGVARELTGEGEGAMRAYEQAMAVNPARPEPYFNLFRARLVAGDTTEAAAVLTAYAAQDSTTGNGRLARTLLRGLGRPVP